MSTSGVPGDAGSHRPKISHDGRYVAFVSSATNLVANDTNDCEDVFVRDRVTGVTERVSVSSTGAQGNDDSSHPSISADGRYVVFLTYATNLVTGSTGGLADLLVRDRQAGTTRRVSAGRNGAIPNDDSFDPHISADGRYVAFTSYASNLILGDTNGRPDVFVRNLQLNTTMRVSVGPGGVPASDEGESDEPSISADGRYVAFASTADNFVAGGIGEAHTAVYVRDVQAGTTTLVSANSAGAPVLNYATQPVISADGRYVAFICQDPDIVPGDAASQDVLVKDRQTGAIESVSAPPDGSPSTGIGLISDYHDMSADGRYVVFTSGVSNLVPNDTNESWDIFLHDRVARVTRRISVTENGGQISDYFNSTEAAVSGDGRFVALHTEAPLLPGGTDAVTDVYIRQVDSFTPANDVDGNGVFDTADVVAVLRFVGGVAVGSSQHASSGDADGDGALTLRDAALLFRRLNGM